MEISGQTSNDRSQTEFCSQRPTKKKTVSEDKGGKKLENLPEVLSKGNALKLTSLPGIGPGKSSRLSENEMSEKTFWMKLFRKGPRNSDTQDNPDEESAERRETNRKTKISCWMRVKQFMCKCFGTSKKYDVEGIERRRLKIRKKESNSMESVQPPRCTRRTPCDEAGNFNNDPVERDEAKFFSIRKNRTRFALVLVAMTLFIFGFDIVTMFRGGEYHHLGYDDLLNVTDFYRAPSPYELVGEEYWVEDTLLMTIQNAKKRLHRRSDIELEIKPDPKVSLQSQSHHPEGANSSARSTITEAGLVINVSDIGISLWKQREDEYCKGLHYFYKRHFEYANGKSQDWFRDQFNNSYMTSFVMGYVHWAGIFIVLMMFRIPKASRKEIVYLHGITLFHYICILSFMAGTCKFRSSASGIRLVKNGLSPACAFATFFFIFVFSFSGQDVTSIERPLLGWHVLL